jgi:hypothetical protein
MDKAVVLPFAPHRPSQFACGPSKKFGSGLSTRGRLSPIPHALVKGNSAPVQVLRPLFQALNLHFGGLAEGSGNRSRSFTLDRQRATEVWAFDKLCWQSRNLPVFSLRLTGKLRVCKHNLAEESALRSWSKLLRTQFLASGLPRSTITSASLPRFSEAVSFACSANRLGYSTVS